MEAREIYTLTEIIVVIILTTIGTIGYLGFFLVNKKIVVNTMLVFALYFMNLFVVLVLVESLRLANYFKFRYLAELLGAYGGNYILLWVDKRTFKIFDSLAKKTGILDGEHKIEQNDNP
ncbi:hypothetical protein [Epilithonimonas sp.]|uniref:hypothetical protein n=1 Tax=Epilithonimonas sp. TaxID=2894511 RepID=UPI0035B47F68